MCVFPPHEPAVSQVFKKKDSRIDDLDLSLTPSPVGYLPMASFLFASSLRIHTFGAGRNTAFS